MNNQHRQASIVLIGMPGSGKSTVGVLLAKQLGLRFIDTDLDIQQRAGATLQEILEARGYLYLRTLEEEVLLDCNMAGAVLATGGSVIYSDRGMTRLADAGPLVHLRAPLATLSKRVANAPPRGIASDPCQSLAQVYAERIPLYERYANLEIDTASAGAEEIAGHIAAALQTQL